jgi:hypothetical protein
MAPLHWAYLISNWLVGIFWETFIAATLSEAASVPFAGANEHSPVILMSAGIAHSFCRAGSIRAAGKPIGRGFQGLRAVVMTKNKRAQAAIPHRDARILSCLAWFSSPREQHAAKNSAGR